MKHSKNFINENIDQNFQQYPPKSSNNQLNEELNFDDSVQNNNEPRKTQQHTDSHSIDPSRTKNQPPLNQNQNFHGVNVDDGGASPNLNQPRSTQQTQQTQSVDFNAHFQSLMQNRVQQLNDQFPWSFQPDECDLSMEIFQMYYVPILRSANLRIIFSSNCLTPRDVNFDVSFGDQLFINWIYHPTTFYINLWSNVYRLEFSRPIVIDRYDVMKSLEYTEVTLFNAGPQPIVLSLTTRNVIYLRPQQIYSFTRQNVRKIRNLRGFFNCTTTSRRVSNWEIGAEQRDEMVARLRAAGETEETIIQRTDQLIMDFFVSVSSPTAESAPILTDDQARRAGFEVAEENERVKARERAKMTFMREFIEEFEVDCQIL